MDTVLLILATYYASVTVARLHGPFGWCERFREWVWVNRGYAQQNGVWLRGTDEVTDDWIAAGVQCPLCASLYIAAILVVFTGAGTGIEILAVAGGASALFSIGRYW